MKPSRIKETSEQIVRLNDRLDVYGKRLRDVAPTKRLARPAYEAAVLLSEAQSVLMRAAMVLDNAYEETKP